jgi:hypothetical protein
MNKLPRSFVRPEDNPNYEPEIWQPSWHCFCCHDTGEVKSHLARLVIDGYEIGKDKIPRCQNPGCTAGNYLDSPIFKGVIDYRFDAAICQELDSIEREDWRRTTKLKRQRILDSVEKLSQKMSLRKHKRTSEEEINTKQKHAAVLAGWGLEAQNDAEREWLASRRCEE